MKLKCLVDSTSKRAHTETHSTTAHNGRTQRESAWPLSLKIIPMRTRASAEFLQKSQEMILRSSTLAPSGPETQPEQDKTIVCTINASSGCARRIVNFGDEICSTGHNCNFVAVIRIPADTPTKMHPRALDLARDLQRRAQDLVDALQKDQNEPGNVQIVEAESHVRQSIKEFERETLQPCDFLSQLGVQQQLFMCMHWLCYFNIGSAVPTGHSKTITYEELAQKADVPLTTMKSVIRMAMIYGVFRETLEGTLQHTRLSSAFATDSDVYNWMMYMAKETAPTIAHFVKATERWPNSENKCETAYSLSRGTSLAFFDHINLVPERANEFGTYMKSQAMNRKGTSVDLLAEGFDWGSLGRATVVDVRFSSPCSIQSC